MRRGVKRSATASPRQAWRAVSATCAPATAPKRRPYARPRQTSSQRSACRSQWARHRSGSLRDRSGASPAVLSYRMWQRLFDGDPNVLGQSIWIDNQPHTIVGVLPQRFWFSRHELADLDARSTAARSSAGRTARKSSCAARTAMTPAHARGAAADAGWPTTRAQLPAAERDLRLRVSGVEGTPIGHRWRSVLPYILGASVLLTLLIACANVAILMIAQWTAREHEIAIRASIGASRGRIVRDAADRIGADRDRRRPCWASCVTVACAPGYWSGAGRRRRHVLRSVDRSRGASAGRCHRAR